MDNAEEFIVLEFDGEFISGISFDGVDMAVSFRGALRFGSYDHAMTFALLCAEYAPTMKEHPERLHAYRLIGL